MRRRRSAEWFRKFFPLSGFFLSLSLPLLSPSSLFSFFSIFSLPHSLFPMWFSDQRYSRVGERKLKWWKYKREKLESCEEWLDKSTWWGRGRERERTWWGRETHPVWWLTSPMDQGRGNRFEIELTLGSCWWWRSREESNSKFRRERNYQRKLERERESEVMEEEASSAGE